MRKHCKEFNIERRLTKIIMSNPGNPDLTDDEVKEIADIAKAMKANPEW